MENINIPCVHVWQTMSPTYSEIIIYFRTAFYQIDSMEICAAFKALVVNFEYPVILITHKFQQRNSHIFSMARIVWAKFKNFPTCVKRSLYRVVDFRCEFPARWETEFLIYVLATARSSYLEVFVLIKLCVKFFPHSID